jgi:CheY-like chemotaxis protein
MERARLGNAVSRVHKVVASKNILALTADFNSGVQIADTARTLGARCVVVRSAADLLAKLGDAPADLVVIDLQLAGLDPEAVVQQIGRGNGGAPIIAFGRHTEAASLRAAREAGCAEVLVRSDFFPRVAEVLAKHLAPRG